MKKITTGYYVNYGCGMTAPEFWINFDSSPTLRFERLPLIGRLYTKNKTRFPKNIRYGDIVKGLPLPNESCSAIYASHILEHLSLNEFRIALINTFKLLIPGGIFRLIVPDLESYVTAYINSSSPDAAEVFMRSTSLGHLSRPQKIMDFLKNFIGNSTHLWIWDFKSLSNELKNKGFIDIRKCVYGDYTENMFRYVEDKNRFLNAICVECFKPYKIN